MSGLQRGDDDAFETLVQQYSGRMLATARRVLGTEDEAKDAVQDAFLSAFKGIGQFTGNAKLSTWLHRIVLNAALMKLRSRRRKPRDSIDELLPRFDAQGAWASPVNHWDIPSEELLQRREIRELIRRSIDRLPESYWTVLLLRDIEELDTEEVARLLGITANAVKIRLHRARQALRTVLEQALLLSLHSLPEPVPHMPLPHLALAVPKLGVRLSHPSSLTRVATPPHRNEAEGVACRPPTCTLDGKLFE